MGHASGMEPVSLLLLRVMVDREVSFAMLGMVEPRLLLLCDTQTRRSQPHCCAHDAAPAAPKRGCSTCSRVQFSSSWSLASDACAGTSTTA